MKRLITRKRIALLAVLALAAIGAFAAYSYFTNTGTTTKTGAATVGTTTNWTVAIGDGAYTAPYDPTYTPTALQPTAPGDNNAVVETFAVSITNNDESDQHLGSYKIELGTLPTGCTAANFQLGVDNGTTIDWASAGAAYLANDLGLTLYPKSDNPDNVYELTAAIRMIETNVSQDACKDASIDLKVTANTANQT